MESISKSVTFATERCLPHRFSSHNLVEFPSFVLRGVTQHTDALTITATHCFYNLIICQNCLHVCIPTAIALIQAKRPFSIVKPTAVAYKPVLPLPLVFSSPSPCCFLETSCRNTNTITNIYYLKPNNFFPSVLHDIKSLMQFIRPFTSGFHLLLKLHFSPLSDCHSMSQSYRTFSS